MSKLLWDNGTAGVTVGLRKVFTLSGAIDRYKIAVEVAYGRHNGTGLTVEGASFLSDFQNDLVNNCGMTWDDVEKIEFDYLKTF